MSKNEIKVGDKVAVLEYCPQGVMKPKAKIVGYVREIRLDVFSGKMVADIFCVAGYRGMSQGWYLTELHSAN